MHQPAKSSRLLTMLLLCSIAWWLLTEGDIDAWFVGVPTVLFVTCLAFQLQNSQAPAICWRRLPGFFWFFIRRSVSAGVDVARRTLKPKLDLRPGLLRYQLRLTPGTPRLLFIAINSLLPGNLCADIEGNVVILHVLDTHADNEKASDELERQIAHLFDLSLEHKEEVQHA